MEHPFEHLHDSAHNKVEQDLVGLSSRYREILSRLEVIQNDCDNLYQEVTATLEVEMRFSTKDEHYRQLTEMQQRLHTIKELK